MSSEDKQIGMEDAQSWASNSWRDGFVWGIVASVVLVAAGGLLLMKVLP